MSMAQARRRVEGACHASEFAVIAGSHEYWSLVLSLSSARQRRRRGPALPRSDPSCRSRRRCRRVGESALIHEAVVGRLAHLRTARGDTGGYGCVDALPALTKSVVADVRLFDGSPSGNTALPLGDPSKSLTSATTLFVESREGVDAAVTAGVAAGGSEVGEPADYGFMYQRGLTDPDGNVVDFGWMDPNPAAAQGPDAVAAQQN